MGSRSEVEGVSCSALAGLLLAGRVMDTRACQSSVLVAVLQLPGVREVVSAAAAGVGAS